MVKVVFTIDDEVGDGSKNVPKAFDRVLSGNMDGKEYGSPLISKMLERYNISANFFLSVLESCSFGDKKYGDHAKKLMEQGHEVDLHTHPIYWDDTRRFMHQYSYTEQKAIISFGVQKIIDYTEKSVNNIIHRAGSYSANLDTYKALAKSSIFSDSSYYESSACKVWNGTKNKPFHIQRVQVFPVTSVPFQVRKKSIPIPFYRKAYKLDINQQSASAIKKVLINPPDFEYVIIFLHSFSFLNLTPKYQVQSINYRLIQDFESLLQFIKVQKIETSTLQKLPSFSQSNRTQ